MKSFVTFFSSLLVLFGYNTTVEAANPPPVQYILHVRPDGPLGRDLNIYYDKVRKSKAPTVAHEALTKYNPHCTVTGFFIPTLTDEEYLEAIPDAIAVADTQAARSIRVATTFTRGDQLDYIKLTSAYLSALSQAYIDAVGLSQKQKKGPPGFTFHVTLRNVVYPTKNTEKVKKIQRMQKQYINLKHHAGWNVYLYKCVNNVMIPIGKPVTLIP
jgi:hypothetical protein